MPHSTTACRFLSMFSERIPYMIIVGVSACRRPAWGWRWSSTSAFTTVQCIIGCFPRHHSCVFITVYCIIPRTFCTLTRTQLRIFKWLLFLLFLCSQASGWLWGLWRCAICLAGLIHVWMWTLAGNGFFIKIEVIWIDSSVIFRWWPASTTSEKVQIFVR